MTANDPNLTELLNLLSTMGTLGWVILLVVLVLLVVLILPPFIVLFSSRVRGGEKFKWFILTAVFSWLAWIPYLRAAKAGKKQAGNGA